MMVHRYERGPICAESPSFLDVQCSDFCEARRAESLLVAFSAPAPVTAAGRLSGAKPAAEPRRQWSAAELATRFGAGRAPACF